MKGALLVCFLLVGGCAGYQERPDPFAEFSATAESPTEPHRLPPWPAEVEARDGGAWFGPEATVTLERYRQAAEANTAIAAEHAAQITALQDAVQGLAEAGSATHRLAETRGAALAEERRARLWDRWFWGAIAALGLGLAVE